MISDTSPQARMTLRVDYFRWKESITLGAFDPYPMCHVVWRFLQVFGGKTGMFDNPCQHLWSDFFPFMKCEYIIGPPGPSQNTVRGAGLSFDDPANAKQSSEDLIGSG